MKKKMEKMKRMLQEDDDQLIVYGCSSHWLNLLGQELTPSLIMKHVVEVTKYFRNHHQPAAWLKELSETVKPQLPGDTRWNSQLTCIETFIRNHAGYTHIANMHEHEIDKNIMKLIRDFNLLKQVKDLSKQLKPVAIALDRLQGDKVSIADACDTWLDLLSDNNLQPHRKAVEARFKLAIQPCTTLLTCCIRSIKAPNLMNSSKKRLESGSLVETQNCCHLFCPLGKMTVTSTQAHSFSLMSLQNWTP